MLSLMSGRFPGPPPVESGWPTGRPGIWAPTSAREPAATCGTRSGCLRRCRISAMIQSEAAASGSIQFRRTVAQPRDVDRDKRAAGPARTVPPTQGRFPHRFRRARACGADVLASADIEGWSPPGRLAFNAPAKPAFEARPARAVCSPPHRRACDLVAGGQRGSEIGAQLYRGHASVRGHASGVAVPGPASRRNIPLLQLHAIATTESSLGHVHVIGI